MPPSLIRNLILYEVIKSKNSLLNTVWWTATKSKKDFEESKARAKDSSFHLGVLKVWKLGQKVPYLLHSCHYDLLTKRRESQLVNQEEQNNFWRWEYLEEGSYD